MTITYSPGNIVQARGRQWIVLPDSSEELLMVRPMGGLDDEVVGICTALEEVRSANFSVPDPAKPGDFNSCRLLRDAARLSTRAAAGPFRCFGKVAVEPRPYQLVPLMMALRQETVRLLIADDVGIGKTVEASLIAKELLERLLSGYERKYPEEIASWRERMRGGYRDGSRVLLRYTPV